MFLSKFRRQSGDEITVVQRVEAYTKPLGTDARIAIHAPALAERHMLLLVDRFERELKRYGDA